MLGLSLAAFTLLHVAISLIAILAGIVFFAALARGRWLKATNGVFLVFTILTSLTGFMFLPPKPPGPPFVLGVISMVLLVIALFALYGWRRGGWWRRLYLLAALTAQWLNMVVLVVQSYQKIPALHAIAPTGAEPAVVATQGVVFVALVVAGVLALRRA